MAGTYLSRSLEAVVRRAAREFPVVVVTGPRQSGKTTLLRHCFGTRVRYVSIETPDVKEAAVEDPRAFLDAHPPPVILDEIQHAPALLPYIKERVDAERRRKGRYLLTGSQNILLMETVTESLAGRAAVLHLLPLSERERHGEPGARLPWQRGAGRRASAPAYADLWRDFLRGSFPELAADPGRDAGLWHGSYVQTYLERDVRSLRQVGDLGQFQSFLRALAARSGALLNLTELSRDLGVAVNTAKAWLSVLEATFQVRVLRPYHANVQKRLVKTPKVYFTDVGTLCYLTGLRDPAHAAAGPMGGAIFETAVLAEITKTLLHRGEEPRIWFWRTAAGAEVDFLVEHEGGLVPLEARVSATPRRAMADGIRRLRDDVGDRIGAGFVVHPGDVRLPLGDNVTALPFGTL